VLSRILIADDHPLFRAALIQLLSGSPGLEVVGEASDGREAVELCRRLRPELVLMDIKMPEIDGLEATRKIKQEMPSTIILMLTAWEDPNHLLEALKAGAAGYVLKDTSAQQIAEAIRTVLEGGSPLNQEVAMHLFGRLIQEKRQREGLGDSAPFKESSKGRQKEYLPAQLTPREVEVLRLLAQGQTNRQISRNLRISISTVKNHVHHIIAKLEVSDRIQAAVVAIEHGLPALGVIELMGMLPTDLMI
jgi:DNA-binding NarL/FixJ family response regulator